jgi:hypothetical protein
MTKNSTCTVVCHGAGKTTKVESVVAVITIITCMGTAIVPGACSETSESASSHLALRIDPTGLVTLSVATTTAQILCSSAQVLRLLRDHRPKTPSGYRVAWVDSKSLPMAIQQIF